MAPKKSYLRKASERFRNLRAQWRLEAAEVQVTVVATSAVVTSSTSVVVTTSCATSTVVVTVCSTATSSAVSSCASHDTTASECNSESIISDEFSKPAVDLLAQSASSISNRPELHLPSIYGFVPQLIQKKNEKKEADINPHCEQQIHSPNPSHSISDVPSAVLMEDFAPLARSTPLVKKGYGKTASECNYQSIISDEFSKPAVDLLAQSASSIPNRPELQLPSTSGFVPQPLQMHHVKKVLNFDDLEAILLSTSLDDSVMSLIEDDSEEEEMKPLLPPGNFVSHIPMEGITHSENEVMEEKLPMAKDGKEGLQTSQAARRSNLMKDFSSLIVQDAAGNENIFAELAQLNALISKSFICRDCESNKISFKINKNQNRTFCNIISTYCNFCKKTLSSTSTSSVQQLPKNYKIKFTRTNNLRFALGAISSGIGYAKANKFFSHLNLPPLSYTTYNALLSDATTIIDAKLESMKLHAAKVVSKYYKDHFNTDEVDGAIDISVSFDGTWMTRGHDSQYGVSFIIDSETGIILDVYVASKYCHTCKIKNKSMDPAAFKEWHLQHKNSKQCEMNYDPNRSSGGMEAEGAKVLFGRSMARKLRYSTIISDEDSSTFVNLTKANIYGKDHLIKKINCLNHISKKIYKKLNEAKMEQSLGHAFANFYRSAIKKFAGKNDKIRKTILASIFHHASTDAKPLHHLCNKKWCKYKRDLSSGQTIAPTWHVDKSNIAHTLNEKSALAVFQVFKEMLKDKVLDLVSGKTQNMNESVHSKLWNIVPKISFRGYKCVLYAVCQTVLEHNCGMHEGNIYRNLGLSVGNELQIGETRREKKRKRPLKARERGAKKRKRTKPQNKSKDKDYNPGGF